MTDAALTGDYPTADALNRHMVNAIDLLFSDVNPIPVKTAMKAIGFDCGQCRLPLTRPTAALEDKIISYFH